MQNKRFVESATSNMQKIVCIVVILCFALNAKAYRIEISNRAIANYPVFLAGYYGEFISVVDSAMANADGKAVFERDYDLCTGLYTVLVHGILQYDLLIDARQNLRIEWSERGELSVDGDEQLSVWVEYQAFADSVSDRSRLAERRRQIIADNPDSFLAAYLTALQPLEPPSMEITGDFAQLMIEYRNRRRNFFVNMPLSDVRLLRTPIYHENIHYYVTQFVTQHADSLIHIGYSMLEQAADNYETFYYVSDFLIDYSLRNRPVENINRFFNFIQRNRDMLGTRGMAMIPARSGTNYFELPDERSLQNILSNMQLTDIEGQTFDMRTIDSRYRIFYFWRDNCPRCTVEASRWQAVINRYRSSSVSGIAVNVNDDVQMSENRILAYDPLCVNVSINNMPVCQKIFLSNYYSKIIVTDTEGSILGVFTSANTLDTFLRIAFSR